MNYDQKQITDYFAVHTEAYAYVKMISEADYGCEEHDDRQQSRSYVVLVTREGETSHEVADTLLEEERIAEDTYISMTTYKHLIKQ